MKISKKILSNTFLLIGMYIVIMSLGMSITPQVASAQVIDSPDQLVSKETTTTLEEVLGVTDVSSTPVFITRSAGGTILNTKADGEVGLDGEVLGWFGSDGDSSSSQLFSSGNPLNMFGVNMSRHITSLNFSVQDIENLQVTATVVCSGSNCDTPPPTEDEEEEEQGQEEETPVDEEEVVLSEEEEEEIVTPPVVSLGTDDGGGTTFGQIIDTAKKTVQQTSKFLQESEALTAVSIAATPAVAVTSAAGASAVVGISEIPVVIYRSFAGLLNALGLRKKGKKFGYVYDAVTKEPLSLAVVRFFSTEGALLSTEVTNVYGHFNTNLKPGEYKLTASRSNYKFPSTIVQGNMDYPIANVYHGTVSVMDDKDVDELSIPLDPTEVTHTAKLSTVIRTRLYQVWHTIGTVLFIVGLFQSVHNYVIAPSDKNFALLIVYLILATFVVFRGSKERQQSGIVTYEGLPFAGVEVVLKRAGEDKVLDKRVTKEDGSYRFVVTKGKYEFDILSNEYELDSDSHYVIENNSNKPIVYSAPLKLQRKLPSVATAHGKFKDLDVGTQPRTSPFPHVAMPSESASSNTSEGIGG